MNPLKNKTESGEQKQKIKEGKTSTGERKVSKIRFLGVLQDEKLATLQMMDEVMTL